MDNAQRAREIALFLKENDDAFSALNTLDGREAELIGDSVRSDIRVFLNKEMITESDLNQVWKAVSGYALSGSLLEAPLKNKLYDGTLARYQAIWGTDVKEAI